MRQEKERGTEVGLLAASYTDRGLYFPDEVALRIVWAWLDAHGCRFLFDGFPRSLPQAQAFSRELAHRSASLDAVIALDVPAEEIYRRVLDRLTCADCGQTYSATLGNLAVEAPCLRPSCDGRLVQRADDQIHVMENRLRQHETLTRPLLDFYNDQGVLIHVDGVGTPEVIVQRTLTLLGENP